MQTLDAKFHLLPKVPPLDKINEIFPSFHHLNFIQIPRSIDDVVKFPRAVEGARLRSHLDKPHVNTDGSYDLLRRSICSLALHHDLGAPASDSGFNKTGFMCNQSYFANSVSPACQVLSKKALVGK